MSEQSYQRTILMGDPSHFSVKGGANPHTRTRMGRKRSVDRELAISQWHRLRDTLQDLGVRVIVVPAHPDQPGLVYPANAGFMTEVDVEKPLNEKTFYLSNLLPSRAGEQQHYKRILDDIGCCIENIDESFRFEGEADFFPACGMYFLTGGSIRKQRFVPHIGLPPWKRIYGFRTDMAVIQELAPLVKPTRIIRIRLMLEAHYHGDTTFCAFGPKREHLLVYRPALDPDGWRVLEDNVTEQAWIALSDADAKRYAANSFALNQNAESFLIMPDGVSTRLQHQIRERGVTPVTVDVSEFLKKGGGSVKCMIGDLGPIRAEDLRIET